MSKLLLVLGALLVALPIGAVVVLGILSDVRMLVQAGGWPMLLIYLVVPVCIGLYALLSDDPDRHRPR